MSSMGRRSTSNDGEGPHESNASHITTTGNNRVTLKPESLYPLAARLDVASSSSAVTQEELAAHHGHTARTSTSGALSAPPPPGFNVVPPIFERTHKVNQYLWNESPESTATTGPQLYGNNNKRTTSFTNLAAVLGTGLVESMDDSTSEQQKARDVSPEGQQRLVDETFDACRDLSYTRQSRHAASRLIGKPSRSHFGAVGSGHVEGSLSSPEPASSTGRDESSSGASPTLNFPVAPVLSGLEERPLDTFARDRNLPPKDLGLTVMEPGGRGRLRSAPRGELVGLPATSGTPLSQPSNHELEHDMQRLSVEEEARRSSPFSGGSGAASRPLDISQLRSESELLPFVWDAGGPEPSRALVILRSSSLYIPDIRSTCEAFGVLETFRSDFSDYGIIFVCYFDIRSSQYAALELQSCLKRLATPDRPADDIRVQYCVPLNASSANDESILHLSEVPPGVGEEILSSVLSSYGAVRSLRKQTPAYGSTGYIAEFHNVQDARQALMELESTQPWGSDLIVEVGTRSPAVRRRGRELLALIGRWRQAIAAGRHPSDIGHESMPSSGSTSTAPGIHLGGMRSPSSTSSSPAVAAPEAQPGYAQYSLPGAGPGSLDDTSSSNRSQTAQPTTQLVLGPDGRYSYMVVNHASYHPAHPQVDANLQTVAQQHTMQVPPRATYISHGLPPPGQGVHVAPVPNQGHAVHYWQHAAPAPHSFHHPGSVVSHQPTRPQYPPGANPSAVPYYAHVRPTDLSISSGSANNPALGVSPRRVASVEEKDNRHLMLDISSVETGDDIRTSLMIRNIPNKYTQHMLLSELAENGHGPGKIDFFYLPIDFKNRCNRGYAFVNFVDHRDIVPFHRQYFGQHWRVFNSDKICDITYARIQGKSGMLKRFENSALMEKDDEYKPLVFGSHGIDKGKRLPFP